MAYVRAGLGQVTKVNEWAYSEAANPLLQLDPDNLPMPPDLPPQLREHPILKPRIRNWERDCRDAPPEPPPDRTVRYYDPRTKTVIRARWADVPDYIKDQVRSSELKKCRKARDSYLQDLRGMVVAAQTDARTRERERREGEERTREDVEERRRRHEEERRRIDREVEEQNRRRREEAERRAQEGLERAKEEARRAREEAERRAQELAEERRGLEDVIRRMADDARRFAAQARAEALRRAEEQARREREEAARREKELEDANPMDVLTAGFGDMGPAGWIMLGLGLTSLVTIALSNVAAGRARRR